MTGALVYTRSVVDKARATGADRMAPTSQRPVTDRNRPNRLRTGADNGLDPVKAGNEHRPSYQVPRRPHALREWEDPQHYAQLEASAARRRPVPGTTYQSERTAQPATAPHARGSAGGISRYGCLPLISGALKLRTSTLDTLYARPGTVVRFKPATSDKVYRSPGVPRAPGTAAALPKPGAESERHKRSYMLTTPKSNRLARSEAGNSLGKLHLGFQRPLMQS